MSGIQEKQQFGFVQNANLHIGINQEIKEVFIPIIGYEKDYLISNMGRVRTIKTNPKGFILKNQNDKDGYHHVTLCKSGKKKTKKIHQMVVDAFYPIVRIGTKLLVDHKDNDRKNNLFTNLRLVDYLGNQLNRIDSIKFKSQFHGVYYQRNCKNNWVARKTINGVRKYLGHFNTEKEAYNKYVTS